MDGITLGRRIKEARLAKKMTQSEVVGDFITRNMLSQIESGAATPSIKTLEYLCRVLEIPLGTLMPDENGNDTAFNALDYINIRDCFIQKNYRAVADSETPDDFPDEVTAIKAKACCYLAQELSVSEKTADLQSAVDYAGKAKDLSKQGIFANESVETAAEDILKKTAERLSEYYKSLT